MWPERAHKHIHARTHMLQAHTHTYTHTHKALNGPQDLGDRSLKRDTFSWCCHNISTMSQDEFNLRQPLRGRGADLPTNIKERANKRLALSSKIYYSGMYNRITSPELVFNKCAQLAGVLGCSV